jgi:hypothetical protein
MRIIPLASLELIFVGGGHEGEWGGLGSSCLVLLSESIVAMCE